MSKQTFTIDEILERWPDVLPLTNLDNYYNAPYLFLHRFSFLCNPSFNGQISGFITYPVKYTTEEDSNEKTLSRCPKNEAQAWAILATVRETGGTSNEWLFDVENEKTAKELIGLLTSIGIHFD